MDDYSAPQPPENEEEVYKILIPTFTCVTVFLLFVVFLIEVTRFRLWHDSWILKKIPKWANNPLSGLIALIAPLVALALDLYKNELYSIWLIVLIIAYDNIANLSSGFTPGSSWLLREFAKGLYNIFLVYVIFKGHHDEYFVPLMVLWSLVLVKFSIRLVCYKLLKRAYGVDNSKLVSDYMKIEHELPNPIIDPRSMEGYRYLVMGEGKIDPKVTGPEYTAEIDLPLPPGVVTVERVWSSNADDGQKHVCLSFAFFKLLKRRYFGYQAAEAQQEKTRQLVFEGLLSWDHNSVYRVIETEIGFLRDFFYTRYPVVFALGFPVIHVIVLIGMFGVSLWISVLAFHRREDPSNSYLRSKHHHHNIDYTITNALLIIIMVMESFETLPYVFSDWTKVLELLRKGKLSRSLNNKIGQFSLLENCNRKGCPDWLRVNCFRYSTWGWSPLKVAPRGMKRDKAVHLSSSDVKKAILGSLRMVKEYPTRGVASLESNGVDGDLAWTCSLKTEYHTLMVWHIATSLCAIHPVKEGGSEATSLCAIHPVNVGGNEKEIHDHLSVASHLSKYCAYLVVFLPDMLPDSIFSVKLFFRKILLETKEFFRGERNPNKQYEEMMQFEGDGNRVVDQGVRLGKYLMEIPDDTHRWKIMADFWSEFILFLAPSGKVEEHVRKLESGGEFITHLWALLYHAGIDDTTIPESIP